MKETQFKLGELPHTLYDSITAELKNYATFFVAGNQFLGSGTFVKVDNVYGILTARHVWEKVEEKARTNGLVGYAISEQPHSHFVPLKIFSPKVGKRGKSKCWGPDLEFVALPVPEVSAVKARMSFYDLTMKAAKKKQHALLSRYGVTVVTGFPAEAAVETAARNGTDRMLEQNGFGFISGVDVRRERGRHDYLDIGVSYESPNQASKSFGGVSGAGVWQVPLFDGKDGTVGSTHYKDFYLAGVAFYQSAVRRKYRILRAHGPKSLYDFLPEKIAC